MHASADTYQKGALLISNLEFTLGLDGNAGADG
jgi:hypothetical protein